MNTWTQIVGFCVYILITVNYAKTAHLVEGFCTKSLAEKNGTNLSFRFRKTAFKVYKLFVVEKAGNINSANSTDAYTERRPNLNFFLLCKRHNLHCDLA